ncbi:MAG: hypothetical protein WAN35_06685 [Terracidiphilus sp.]
MPIDRRNLPSYIRRPVGEWAVVSENKRCAKFRKSGADEVYIIHVDGGLITAGERADYIVAHTKIVDVIVELKGSDTSKAINQIRTTRPVWMKHELAGSRFGALIVRGQGLHPKESVSIDRWKREFRKTFKMKLLVETRNREYEFSEFLLPEGSRA